MKDPGCRILETFETRCRACGKVGTYAKVRFDPPPLFDHMQGLTAVRITDLGDEFDNEQDDDDKFWPEPDLCMSCFTAQERKEEAILLGRRVAAYRKSFGARFQNANLGQIAPSTRKMLFAWADNCDDWCLRLVGPSGSGKSYAAFALLANHMENTGDGYPHMQHLDLIAEARSCAGQMGSLHRAARDATMLLIDNVVQATSGAAEGMKVSQIVWEMTFDIIDRRWRSGALTMLTSVLETDEAWEAAYGAEIVSRLADGTTISMSGKDKRGRFK